MPYQPKSRPWTAFERAYLPPVDPVELAAQLGISLEEAREQVARLMKDVIWKNSRYQVNIDYDPPKGHEMPKMIHLSIKRLDKRPIHDWRDLQRIKNELVGEENEAIELYPAESRLVDSANQYHLWVFADPSFTLPLGWTQRYVRGPESMAGSNARQREFEH